MNLKQKLTAMAEREAEVYEPDDLEGIRQDFIAGHASLHDALIEAVEALEEIGAPLGVPLSLITGDIKQACKDLNEERREKQLTATKALASIERKLGEK